MIGVEPATRTCAGHDGTGAGGRADGFPARVALEVAVLRTAVAQPYQREAAAPWARPSDILDNAPAQDLTSMNSSSHVSPKKWRYCSARNRSARRPTGSSMSS